MLQKVPKGQMVQRWKIQNSTIPSHLLQLMPVTTMICTQSFLFGVMEPMTMFFLFCFVCFKNPFFTDLYYIFWVHLLMFLSLDQVVVLLWIKCFTWTEVIYISFHMFIAGRILIIRHNATNLLNKQSMKPG